MDKRDLFFYFILMLRRNYDLLKSDIILNRFMILNLLYITCIKDNRLLENLWENFNFNKFYTLTLKNFVVEADCYWYIYEIWDEFENIITDEEKIKKEIKNKIDKNIMKIIEESTIKLGIHFYDKTEEYLSKYVKLFNSYNNSELKALNYWKPAFEININDIKEDWKEKHIY